MPYLCINASSTVRSSFRLIGTGRFCVYMGRSSFGVSFTLKVFWMSMSSAKMSLYSTIVCSSCFLSLPSICDPSYLNISRNSFLDSGSLVGSSCSFFMSFLISFNIRRCIVVCSSSFSGFRKLETRGFRRFIR